MKNLRSIAGGLAMAVAATGAVLTVPTSAEAATRQVVTRAEYNSIRTGDTIADVQRKTGVGGDIVDREKFAIFATGERFDNFPDGFRVIGAGASQQRAYNTPNMRYYPKDCENVQITFIRDGGVDDDGVVIPGIGGPGPGGAGGAGPYRVVDKENWSNICYQSEGNRVR